MNTCEACIHAEMCKWIDELEGRGCDFFDGEACFSQEKSRFSQEVSQEPCDDAVSRADAQTEIMMSKSLVSFDRDIWIKTKDAVQIIRELPPVTQKSGKWINKDVRKEEYVLTGKCSVCGQVRVKDKFCSNCGAKMVEPQESEEQTDAT